MDKAIRLLRSCFFARSLLLQSACKSKILSFQSQYCTLVVKFKPYRAQHRCKLTIVIVYRLDPPPCRSPTLTTIRRHWIRTEHVKTMESISRISSLLESGMIASVPRRNRSSALKPLLMLLQHVSSPLMQHKQLEVRGLLQRACQQLR
jgi:hypothetical protein